MYSNYGWGWRGKEAELQWKAIVRGFIELLSNFPVGHGKLGVAKTASKEDTFNFYPALQRS